MLANAKIGLRLGFGFGLMAALLVTAICFGPARRVQFAKF